VRRQVNGHHRPACASCPKFVLHPDGWDRRRGLMPENELALDLYWKAQGDVRQGTMDGLYLLRTLTISDVEFVLNLYGDQFADTLDRQEMFEKILLIDRTMSEGRAKAEEEQREAARQQARSAASPGGVPRA
jgi:hypothetical protein